MLRGEDALEDPSYGGVTGRALADGDADVERWWFSRFAVAAVAAASARPCTGAARGTASASRASRTASWHRWQLGEQPARVGVLAGTASHVGDVAPIPQASQLDVTCCATMVRRALGGVLCGHLPPAGGRPLGEPGRGFLHRLPFVARLVSKPVPKTGSHRDRRKTRTHERRPLRTAFVVVGMTPDRGEGRKTTHLAP